MGRRPKDLPVDQVFAAILMLSHEERGLLLEHLAKLPPEYLGEYMVVPRALKRRLTSTAIRQHLLLLRCLRQPRETDRDKRLAELHATGKSYAQLALDEGMTRAAVKSAIKRYRRRTK